MRKHTEVNRIHYRMYPGRFFGCFLLLCLLLALTSGCRKDDVEPEEPRTGFLTDNQLVISNITGIPDGVFFSKVMAEIQGESWAVIHTVEGTYDGEEIILSLPAEFSGDKLMNAVRESYSDYTGFWYARSDNPDARVASLGNIIAYNESGKRVGRLYLTDWSGTGAAEYKSFLYYLYADQAFAVSGTNSSYTFVASFEKGWNAYAIVKSKEIESGDRTEIPSTCTTFLPEDATLTWRFESWVN